MNTLIQLIETYHLSGLLIGSFSFLIIGLFHPIVIKGEYYFGTKIWWIFLIVGILGIIASILIHQFIPSILIGIVAFSSLWSIGEIFEQKKRVEKGWFPKNPKRK